MTLTRGIVVSVNVGGIRDFDYNGRPAKSAIWKTPVTGRVAVRGVNLDGDDQADRKGHGGPHKAVYAFAVEDYQWWEGELGRSLDAAEFGENLTTRDIDVNGAVVGERWEVGSTVLEVSEPRVPCWRLGVRMDDKKFPKRFTQVGRPGSYLRIVTEGELGADDEIRVVSRPEHGMTIADVFRIYSSDRDQAHCLLPIPELSEPWKDWARRMMAKRNDPSPPPCGPCE